MTVALLVLLGFALVASAYVFKKGLEEGEKTTYELVLKCVIIISSVVPRRLMETITQLFQDTFSSLTLRQLRKKGNM